ncbi:MAG: ABC transporter permease, partial [Nanoarchaeota archaeon]
MAIGKESIIYALQNLRHRKARSSLTILSIFIGITTIFIFISFGIGLYTYVNQFSSASSANKLTIQTKGFGGLGFDEEPGFSEEDFRAVKNSAGVYSAETIDFGAAEIKQDKTIKYSFIISYDPAQPFMLIDISGIKILKGRMLQSGDKAKVVLGYNYLLKDKVMPKPYDLNSKITIQGREARVVGFFEPIGNPQDDAQIYMSTDFFKELYPNRSEGYNWIFAEVDVSKIDSVIENVKNALRKSRNVEK